MSEAPDATPQAEAPAAPPPTEPAGKDAPADRSRGPGGKFAPKANGDATPPADAPPTADARRWELNFGDLDPDTAQWAAKFASPADQLRSHREMEKLRGRSVVLPGKNAPPEEIAAFRKALGVPESPDGYKIEIPDVELSEDTKQRLEEFKKEMHSTGAQPAVVQTAVNAWYRFMDAATADHQRQLEEHRKAAEDELGREFGSDFTANVTYGNRFLGKVDPTGQFTAWAQEMEIGGGKLANHPMLVRILARAGRMIAEGTAEMGPDATEAASLEVQISKIRDQRRAARTAGNQALAQQLDQQERALHAKMAGTQPIVGTGGRTA